MNENESPLTKLQKGKTVWQLLQEAEDMIERESHSEKKDKQRVYSITPRRLAEDFLKAQYTVNDVKTLRRWQDSWYRYNGVCYEPYAEEFLKADLYKWLSSIVLRRMVRDKEGHVKDESRGVPPYRKVVGEILAALPSLDILLPNWQAAPFWFDGREGARDLIVFPNGILNIKTKEFVPNTPELFAVNAVDYNYDATASKAPEWHAFLSQLWDGDVDSIMSVQEMFGYCLTQNTHLQKMFMLIGPPRSGKGTIGRVLTGIIGRHNVTAPTLDSFATNFGLTPCIDKMLAIISDARLSGRTNQTAVCERLLCISGEDYITIDRKYQHAWTGRLPLRIMILTNEMPRFTDESTALAKRFVIVALKKSFYGHEDYTLTDKLLKERAAIFNWSMEGYERLNKRMHFVMSPTAEEMFHELENLTSPINAFIQDRCTIAQDREIDFDELYSEWCSWCESEGRTHKTIKQTFGRDLRTVIPDITIARRTLGGSRVRIYEGIGLKTEMDKLQELNQPSDK